MSLIRSCSPLIVVVALVPSVSAEPAAGAQTLDAQIPIEVVMRLLNIESPEQLTLGRLPDEVAQRVKLPADVQIMAAVSRKPSHHHIVGRTGRSAQELRPELVASLERAGWSRPPAAAVRKSGFLSSVEPCESHSFCGPDNAHLTASVRAAEGDLTSLDLNLFTTRDASMCGQQRSAQTPEGTGWADVLIPALEPPARARISGQGSSSSGGEMLNLNATLETELSPDSLVDHYGGQLAAAGWRVGQAARTSRVAAADVEINGPEGDRVSGFLLVW